MRVSSVQPETVSHMEVPGGQSQTQKSSQDTAPVSSSRGKKKFKQLPQNLANPKLFEEKSGVEAMSIQFFNYRAK